MLGVINVDVFNVQVGVFRTDADRLAFLREKGIDGESADAASYAYASMDKDADGVAWFCMVIKDEATYATWAHECVHIADWIMLLLGIPTDASNTEVRGYLVGHLFQGLRDLEPDDDDNESNA